MNARYRKILESSLLYPFLLASYPILALIANNISEIPFQDGVRSLFISVTMTGILLALLRLLLKDNTKASLITIGVVFAFFS